MNGLGHIPLHVTAAALPDGFDFGLAGGSERAEIGDALFTVDRPAVRGCMFQQERAVEIPLDGFAPDGHDPVGKRFLCVRAGRMVVLAGLEVPGIQPDGFQPDVMELAVQNADQHGGCPDSNRAAVPPLRGQTAVPVPMGGRGPFGQRLDVHILHPDVRPHGQDFIRQPFMGLAAQGGQPAVCFTEPPLKPAIAPGFGPMMLLLQDGAIRGVFVRIGAPPGPVHRAPDAPDLPFLRLRFRSQFEEPHAGAGRYRKRRDAFVKAHGPVGARRVPGRGYAFQNGLDKPSAPPADRAAEDAAVFDPVLQGFVRIRFCFRAAGIPDAELMPLPEADGPRVLPEHQRRPGRFSLDGEILMAGDKPDAGRLAIQHLFDCPERACRQLLALVDAERPEVMLGGADVRMHVVFREAEILASGRQGRADVFDRAPRFLCFGILPQQRLVRPVMPELMQAPDALSEAVIVDADGRMDPFLPEAFSGSGQVQFQFKGEGWC